ncbi:MAG: DUF4468 domain-containing protein [Dysgonomonas sp.]
MNTGTKFVWLLLLLFTSVNAVESQNSGKYLKGAVPLVDGKVVFADTITSKKSRAEIKALVEKWVAMRFNSNVPTNRQILSDTTQNLLVYQCSDSLIFKKALLVLDYTTLSYKLYIQIEDGRCIASLRYLRYAYPVKDEVERYNAEELITDDTALSSDGKKLLRAYKNFRVFTIDYKDNLFKSLRKQLKKKQLVEEEDEWQE